MAVIEKSKARFHLNAWKTVFPESFINEIIERLPEELPDIKEEELGYIRSGRNIAKMLVEDWRVKKAICKFLDHLYVEAVASDKDKNYRQMLVNLKEAIEEDAKKDIREAGLIKIATDTLEQFGYKQHYDQSYILYALIPLAILFLSRKF